MFETILGPLYAMNVGVVEFGLRVRPQSHLRYEDPVSVVHSDGHKVIPSAGGREERDGRAKNHSFWLREKLLEKTLGFGRFTIARFVSFHQEELAEARREAWDHILVMMRFFPHRRLTSWRRRLQRSGLQAARRLVRNYCWGRRT